MLFVAIRGLFTNFITVLLLFILLTAVFYVSSFMVGSPVRLLRNKIPISFEAESINGGLYLSKGFKGRKYILYFSSVGCDKCRAQVATFDNIRSEKGIRSYVFFNDQEIKALMDRGLSSYTSAFDAVLIDKKSKIAHANYVYILPHTMLINEGGEIVVDITGRISDRDLKKLFVEIDKEETVPDKNLENAT